MSKYRCTKGFAVQKYDDYENLIENEYLDVEEGSMWEKQDWSSMAQVRLQEEDGRWLEVSKNTLVEHFELVQQ